MYIYINLGRNRLGACTTKKRVTKRDQATRLAGSCMGAAQCEEVWGACHGCLVAHRSRGYRRFVHPNHKWTKYDEMTS